MSMLSLVALVVGLASGAHAGEEQARADEAIRSAMAATAFDDFEAAIEHLRTAVSLRTAAMGPEHVAVVEVQILLCNLLILEGRPEEARADLEALLLHEEEKIRRFAMTSLARIELSLDRPREALALLGIEPQQDIRELSVDTLDAAALAYESMLDWDRALSLRRESVARAEQASESVMQARHNLGRTLLAAGRRHEAARVLRELLASDLMVEEARPDERLSVLQDLVRALSTPHTDPAVPALLEEIETLLRTHAPDDLERRATLLVARANVSMDRGDRDVALSQLTQARALQERAIGGRPGRLAQIDANRAAVLVQLGELEQAERLLNQVLSDHRRDPHLLLNLAQIYNLQGRYAQSRATFDEVLALAEQNESLWLQTRVRTELGVLLLDLGLLEEGLALGERALQTGIAALGPDHLEVGTLHLNLAVHRLSNGLTEGVQVHLDQAERIRRAELGEPGVNRVKIARARLLHLQGDLQASLALSDEVWAALRAQEGSDVRERLDALHRRLRGLLALGRASDGLRDVETLLEMAREPTVRDGRYLERSYRLAALLALAAGDEERARAWLEQAWLLLQQRGAQHIGGLSDPEAGALTADLRTLVDEQLRAFDEPEDARRLLERVLQAKGGVRRMLLERRLAARRGTAGSSAELAAARTALLEASLGRTDAEVASIAGRVERLERAVAASAARDVEALGRPTVRWICEQLRPDEAWVELYRTAAGESQEEGDYVAFVLAGGKNCGEPARVDLGPAGSIDALVGRYRDYVEWNANIEDVWQVGAALRQRVFDPLLTALSGRRDLRIGADGALATLAWGTLVDDGGRYLVEGYGISLAEPGLTTERRPGPAPGGVLLVGDVDFSGIGTLPCTPEGGYERLPGSGREVQAIARWVGEATRLQGAQATEAEVARVAPLHRTVHLATHGWFLDPACPDVPPASQVRSGLVLATSADADGLWTAAEVAQLDLDGVELVVLSACETGLSTARLGEGVTGLRRAFAVAGVQQLVLSLWSVPDEDTAVLFAEFHRSRARGRSTSDALRRAQRHSIRRLRRQDGQAHPLRWGGFIASRAGDLAPSSAER